MKQQRGWGTLLAAAQASHLGSASVLGLMVLLGTGGGTFSLHLRWVACTTTILGAMSGFLINEISDRQIDALAKSYRPLPSGRISPKSARICFLITYSLGWAGSLFVLSVTSTAVFLILFMAVGTGYTPLKYRFGQLKNLYAAICFTLPLVFAFSASGRIAIDWILLVAVFSFLVHRELLMDRADLHADRSAGISTLAFRLKSRGTAVLGASLWGTAMVSASLADLLSWQRLSWLLVLLISSILFVLSLEPRHNKRWRELTLIMWIPMGGFCMLLYR